MKDLKLLKRGDRKGAFRFEGGTTQLTIYGRSAGESVTLKYYDAAKQILYTIPDAVKM